jgi:hypothetical protein
MKLLVTAFTGELPEGLVKSNKRRLEEGVPVRRGEWQNPGMGIHNELVANPPVTGPRITNNSWCFCSPWCCSGKNKKEQPGKTHFAHFTRGRFFTMNRFVPGATFPKQKTRQGFTHVPPKPPQTILIL